MSEEIAKSPTSRDGVLGGEYVLDSQRFEEEHRHQPQPESLPPTNATDGHTHPETPTHDQQKHGKHTDNIRVPETSDEGAIILRDAVKRQLVFPFKIARTWPGMEGLIREACAHLSKAIDSDVKTGRYDLVGPDGSTILSTVWEDYVRPGLIVTMRMWRDIEDERKKDEAAKKKKIAEEAKAAAAAAESQRKLDEKDKTHIKFTDAVGRKFSFPFKLCAKWQGMEELIKQAFLHVEVIGPHVQAGHYDLIGPNGEIILPSVWDRVIEPGYTIKMNMWPMEKNPLPPHLRQGRGVPMGQMPNMRPMGRPPPGSGGPGRGGAPPPPGWMGRGQMPQYPSPIVVDARPTKERKKPERKRGDSIMNFLSGRPAKIKKVSTPDSLSLATADSSEASRGSSLCETSSEDSTDSGSEGSLSDSLDIRQRKSRSKSRRARKEARKKGLIICSVMPRSGLPDPLLRRQTIPTSEKGAKANIKLSRMEISSAQVYSELLTNGGLELFQRTYGSDASAVKSPDGQSRMVWLHVTSSIMDFKIFEDTLFEIPLDTYTRRLAVNLCQSIRRKKLDEEWYIRPGTVLRYDGDGLGKSYESASFVSVPSLYAAPYKETQFRKEAEEICPERRLSEAFGQTNMDGEARGWLGTRVEVGDRPLFWVRQTWILVAGPCILTYGSVSRDDLEGNVISILDDISRDGNGDRGIRVKDQDDRTFFIPAINQKSFYELQGAIIKQLQRMGDEIEDFSLHLRLPSGEDITQQTWPTIQKMDGLSWIDVVLTPLDSSRYSSRRSSFSVTSLNSEEQKIETHEDENSDDQRIQSSKDTAEGNVEHGRFLLLPPPATPELQGPPPFDMPKLNRKVPEFFSWSEQREHNIDEAFREGILRTEKKLAEGAAATKPSDVKTALMSDLHHVFDNDFIYQGMKELTFDQFNHQRRNREKNQNKMDLRVPRQLNDELIHMMDEYFDVAVATLESFVPINYTASLVLKYIGALSETMKDPAVLSGSGDAGSIRWVIQEDKVQRAGSPAAGKARCKACALGTIYDSIDSAASHLQQDHLLGPITETTLHQYVASLTDAAQLKLVENQLGILQSGRDALGSLLRKLVNIQNGAVHDSKLHEKRGLPYELIDAFAFIVAFVCALPNLLHQMCWFYTDILQSHQETMTDKKAASQKRVLLRLIDEAEKQVRRAETILSFPMEQENEDSPVIFKTSVGPQYVAAQIVCNILNMPVNQGKGVTALHDMYTYNLSSKISNHPNKRQIPSITTLANEMRQVQQFHRWQRETVQAFTLILNPETYRLLSPKNTSESDKDKLASRSNIYKFERKILAQEISRLTKEVDQIEQLLEKCLNMIQTVRYVAEIMADDQSRVIFIFTTVTVIFLPLSFVTSYVGMSGGATGLDWGGLQRLFWSVAGPLTVCVLGFCLAIAQASWFKQFLSQPWVGIRVVWARMTRWKPGVVSKSKKKKCREDGYTSSSSDSNEIVDY